MKLRPIVAMLALLNGMIGGLMIILPILVLQTGSLLSLLIIFITGFLSFYSCYLYIQHMGDYTDIDKAIYNHFWCSKAIKVFYDLVVFLNLALLLVSYFLLIQQQWNSMISVNILTPILNAVGLFILILILKRKRFGAHLLGYGVIGIFLYCGFLTWLAVTAPSGAKRIPVAGTGVENLASSMALGFTIQPFFIPVLKQMAAKENRNYTKYTMIVYIVGGIIYIFIAFAGSYGILNRPQIFYPSQTIQDYFNQGQWQVIFIQSIYLICMYTAYGQFLLICKKRFFGMFKTMFQTRNTREGQFFTLQQIIFVIAIIGLGFGIYFANVSIDSLIQINGAVIGFFFIYMFPALMQFKCLYFTKPKQIFQTAYKKIKSTLSRAIITQRSPSVQFNYGEKQTQMTQFSYTNKTQLIGNKKQEIDLHLAQIKSNKSTKQEEKSRQSKSQYQHQYQNQKQDKNIEQNLQKQKQIQGQRQRQTNLQVNLPLDMNNLSAQEQLIPGADLSLIFSEFENDKRELQVTRLIYACPCEKLHGIRKFLDITFILSMLALGFFVMVEGIAHVDWKN